MKVLDGKVKDYRDWDGTGSFKINYRVFYS
jgi:hypothetical protein